MLMRSAWSRFRRSYYTRRAARALGCSPSQLDVSGPCVIHGGGRFVIGQNVSLRATPRLPIELYCAPGATITLADHAFLNQGVHIACMREVSIGENCLIADQALIMDTDFHSLGDEPIQLEPVRIERRAWIGARAIILKGVTIGEAAIVGAGAIVTRSIPARAVAVGNPARLVRDHRSEVRDQRSEQDASSSQNHLR
jgi:acetyltransferase-like isoleucine patch superfamily enzyme